MIPSSLRFCVMLYLSLIQFDLHASNWDSWWLNANQQGIKLLKNNQPEAAEKKFDALDWRATAAYQAQHYEQSAALFHQLNTAEGFYNEGNALAHGKNFAAAIEAYKQALKRNPQMQNARENCQLLMAFLKQENQKKQDSQTDPNAQKSHEQKKQEQKDHGQNNHAKKDQGQPKPVPKEQPSNDEKNGNDRDEHSVVDATAQEEHEANKQWLKLIPDDPGGLLREKFLRDYLRLQS